MVLSEKQPLLFVNDEKNKERSNSSKFSTAILWCLAVLCILRFCLLADLIWSFDFPQRNSLRTRDHVEEYYLKHGPSPELAQLISRNLTAQSHVAGTAGDFKTVESVRDSWARALGAALAQPVLEAGTPESRQAFNVRSNDLPSVHVDTYYTVNLFPILVIVPLY